MTPLVTLLVIGLLLVVVAALLVWALVSPVRGTARTERNAAEATRGDVRAFPTHVPPVDTGQYETQAARPVAHRTNDDVRGAKAPRTESKKESVPDDAFERFLRSGRDEER